VKKFLAIVLALACLLSLCACGGGGSSAGNEGGDDNLTADGRVKLSIGMPSNALVLSLDNNALTRWVEEQCGVELTFIEYAGGTDVPTQISTAIAGRRELPDIIFGVGLATSVINRYGRDGYFLDLSEYYADKEGASKIFWDRMNNELTEAERDHIIRVITDPETGAIYGAPIVETSMIDSMRGNAWINKTWLDKLQLEMPTNNEELVKVLKAFRDKDPNGNGVKDEIPMFGSQNASPSARVVDWVINTFTYYNYARKWAVDDSGKISPVFTQDAYREAVKFVKELNDEKLMSNIVWTCTNDNMKQIVTPSNGTSMVGVFCGHLTLHCAKGNEVMYEYVPLPRWGCAIRGDNNVSLNTYITESCDNVDKAFEVLMALISWEGSMRVRYGEYGANWVDPDPGAKSELGLDATYKLLSDPMTMQNTAHWAKIACCLNIYAEGETAQMDQNGDPWMLKRAQLQAESHALFVQAEENNNPKKLVPIIVATEEEKEKTESIRTNIDSYVSGMLTDFCTGKADPNDDKVWNNYLAKLDEYGLETYTDYVQTAYDRG